MSHRRTRCLWSVWRRSCLWFYPPPWRGMPWYLYGLWWTAIPRCRPLRPPTARRGWTAQNRGCAARSWRLRQWWTSAACGCWPYPWNPPQSEPRWKRPRSGWRYPWCRHWRCVRHSQRCSRSKYRCHFLCDRCHSPGTMSARFPNDPLLQWRRAWRRWRRW